METENHSGLSRDMETKPKSLEGERKDHKAHSNHRPFEDADSKNEKTVLTTKDVTVPCAYHGVIIGKKGSTIRKLMAEYNVRFVIHPAHKRLDTITVIGNSARVEKAMEALKEMVEKLEQGKKQKVVKDSLQMDQEAWVTSSNKDQTVRTKGTLRSTSTKEKLVRTDKARRYPKGVENDQESFNSRRMTFVIGGVDHLVMPSYMKPPIMNQQAPPFHSGGRRKSKEKKVISRPSTASEVKLARSDNPWKPDFLKKKDENDHNEDEELLRRYKSILNKLTPQNFQKLMNQTMQLPINSEERLKGVVDLVFAKATMEPGFSQAYANVCRVMQSIEVEKADGEPVQFRKLILIKCQKQFERDRSDEQVEKERQRIMAITNEEEREEALAELEYQQMIVKKQIIGNIRFIGELFKLQLLTEKIMQNCIFLLLKAKDEESLECMAKLVTTVGQSLDHVKGKALMDQYFLQIDKIIKEKQVPSRIRLMLQDLKDLRGNNWKPRREEAKPVMIDQIRKEAGRLAPKISKSPQEKMEKYQDKDGSKTQKGKEDHGAPWEYLPSHKGRVTRRSESRLRGAIEEYLFVKDFKEVTSSFMKNTSRTSACVFIRIAMGTVLDQKAYMRESMGRLFQKMLTASIISVEQFQIGLNEFLEYKDEMIIDAPLYWTYVGEVIGAMAAEGAQNFSFLKESAQKIEKHFAKFMAEIMKAGVKYTSEQDMNRVWQASGFKWDTFLPEGSNVEEFLNANNLAFTEIPISKASHASIGEQNRLKSFQKNVIQKENVDSNAFLHSRRNLAATETPNLKASYFSSREKNSLANFQRDLILYQKGNVDNDAIVHYIEKRVPKPLRQTNEFIRALVTAVCNGAFKGQETISKGDHEWLKSRAAVIMRYIDGNLSLELQALYAVQHLHNSLGNPPGLLRFYFDVLYGEDVISEDAFYTWRDSKDPTERNGKDIALKSVTSFYTWLEESDTSS